jgi:hypothetical protein
LKEINRSVVDDGEQFDAAVIRQVEKIKSMPMKRPAVVAKIRKFAQLRATIDRSASLAEGANRVPMTRAVQSRNRVRLVSVPAVRGWRVPIAKP